MRASAVGLGLVGWCLTGCMAAPEAEELVLEDEAPSELTELRSIPDHAEPAGVTVSFGRYEPAPAPEPAPEPAPAPASATDQPRFVIDPEAGDCGAVRAEGFPAISLDGTTLVVPKADHLQLSNSPGSLALQWHDVATGRVLVEDTVVADDPPLDEEGECSAAIDRAHRRVVLARNRELSSQRWRSLERLPVELFYSDTYDLELYKEDTPQAERGVQLLVQHGEIIARVAGVRVLERQPLAPHMQGLAFRAWADRETGTVVVVTMGCVGDSCTCDPSFTAQVVHWQPETFAAVDRNPCIDDDEELGGDGEGLCAPIDFGFNDDAYLWSM